jgi:hypothetical protein
MDHSGHGAEIEALLRQQQELVTQLRALILPQLHSVDSGSAELALQLFDDVIGCNTSLVSKLFSVRGGAAAEPVDDKSLVRKNSASTTANDDVIHERMEKQGMPSRSAGGKRRCVCAHISFQINLMHRTCSQKLIKSMFICDILYILPIFNLHDQDEYLASCRRNDGKRSRSLVTNVPDYDGHQWRKYGQKNINGSQHAR